MANARKYPAVELLVITSTPPKIKYSRWINSVARAGLDVVVTGVKNVKLTKEGVHVAKGFRVKRFSDRAIKITNRLTHPKLLYNRGYRPRKNRIFEEIVGQYEETWSSWHPHLKYVSKKSNLENVLLAHEDKGGHFVKRPASMVVTSNNVQRLNSWAGKLSQGTAILLKPSTGTHCKGIEVLSLEKLEQVRKRLTENPNKEYLVQELIDDATLIDGHKFDLRLYALMVLDVDRIAFKLYRQGVCRFAARKFDPNNPLDPISIFSGSSFRKKEGLPVYNGTIAEALEALDQQGLDASDFWQQMECLCHNLLEAISDSAKSSEIVFRRTYFFIGLDVILSKQNGKVVPSLIEVNDLPQLLGWGADVDTDLIPLLYRWGCDMRALTEAPRFADACPHFPRRTSRFLDSRW